MKEIHEAVFQFLLKKREADPTLRYNLRFKAGEKWNEKHYWFHGSDQNNDLYLTFWDAWTTVFPTIIFVIHQDGTTSLNIHERKVGALTELWQELAITLKLTRNTNKAKNPIGFWYKHYNYPNYLESLEHFIKKERPYINSYFDLMGRTDDYPPFPAYDFQKKLSKIETIRKGIQITAFDDFLKQKLTVNCLQLTHINAFESLNISFEKRVTCFVGGNGSGKTTLLRGIALGLAGSKGFNAEELHLLTIKSAKSDLKYQSEGIIDVFYHFKNTDFHNAVFFKSDKEARDFGLADDEGTSLRDPSDAKRLQTLVIGFSQQTQAGNESKANGSYGPKLTDLEALILNKTDNRYNDFIKWLNGLITTDAKKDRNHHKTIIESIFKVINDITGDIIELTSETDTFVKTRQNEEGIPMKLLSQGYRNVLAWLGFFMKRMVEYNDSLPIEIPDSDFRNLPAVCLIDEIDTYLHPDWQYSILSGLVENFPNVQFFITSHSPFVLTSVKSEDFAIFNLKKGANNKIEVQEMAVNLYGADANRATSAISSERKTEVKTEFNELYNAIEENDLKKAQELLNKLEETVDAHLDLGILNAKQLIRTKQLRQKAKQEGQK